MRTFCRPMRQFSFVLEQHEGSLGECSVCLGVHEIEAQNVPRKAVSGEDPYLSVACHGLKTLCRFSCKG
jgi:hypothetical protein